MAITHLTSTAVFTTGTGTRTVTPHASSVAGDLMVLVVAFQDSAATTITTPTGWTVQKSAVQTGTLKTSVFTRVKQASDTTWTFTPSQSVETAHIVLTTQGSDPASVVFGADGTRAASGGAFATTAPSVSTTAANVRAFVIATERTTANETVEATVNNSFTKIVHVFQNGTSAESLFLGFRDIATASAIGATTVTFQNTHATNGYAVLAAVAPAAGSLSAAGTVAAVTVLSGSAVTSQPASGSVPATSVSFGSASTRVQASALVTVTSTASGSAVASHAADGVSSSATDTSGDATTSFTASGEIVTLASTSGVASSTNPAYGHADASSTSAGSASPGLSAFAVVVVTSTAAGSVTSGVFAIFERNLTLSALAPQHTLTAEVEEFTITATAPTLTLEATW